ncbi:MAG: non-canonical purine NTP pyrophosphatase, RdgB/HAM1 family [Porticoccus sp.]|jgi:XTP/dITP diphosphohydrolase|uniref:RdgB/HAM1 family non-canonical purine NTP pyrophosphatase n=1 Tax=Porticoccus hydrocarbonoclasticus TaxID=1073414 RepID=UPI00055FAA59|nr:RdgB/HAM1 family non-canonical purine NTP pyrophosphatase [Porticoccus hydrocarbonoclasticus]MBG58436.1 non-canonical purine NTP pyrophosphatase, RdgB/HAM1 family [Porticoccus sp.]|tara:strand:- start:1036 stop:1635 length:600 start_codon:yes stop_codon:yes gene_type:complete
MKIVLATGNKGKLTEFQHLLELLPFDILPQSDFEIPEAVEDGLSFVENALIKARHASRLTDLPAIADDSGLEVDALNGAPGIYSSRFSGENATDQQNNLRLLSLLQEVPREQRTARFHCLLVYLRHAKDPTPLICQGTWEGLIGFTPEGDNGFGYDPLFYIPELDCTSAQLGKEKKNRISHRAKAMALLQERLVSLYNS